MSQYTPTYGLPYPEGEDRVAVHSDVRALAMKVDTELLPFEATVRAVAQQSSQALNQVAQLESKGVVTGASKATTQDDTAWAQTTDPDANGRAYRLPLGYRADGHLDDFARRVWLEDTEDATLAYDPEYRMVRQTPDGHIIYAEKWDGTVLIPGLTGVPSAHSAQAPTVLDAPYVPDSRYIPVHVDMSSWAGWGSSTMEGLATAMSAVADNHGATWYNGGKGSERLEHHAARLGSHPARIVFPNDTIPASGTVAVDTANQRPFLPGAMQSFDCYVTATDGTRIYGTLSKTTQIFFTRTTPGAATPVARGVAAIPVDGVAHRNDLMFLQVAKNSLTKPEPVHNDPVRAAEETLEMVEFQAAHHKRVLVLGQFINSGTPAVSDVRDRITAYDAILAQELGPTFFDTTAWVTSPDFWDDIGLTPNQSDLDDQALGNKPRTGSADAGHFNATGYTAYANKIENHLQSLHWIN